MNEGPQILLRVTDNHHLADEWELVLLAQGLSPSVRRTANGFVLSVPQDQVDTARASLSAYEQENPPKLAERIEPVEPGSLLAGIAIALMLLLFFFTTVQWLPTLSWLARGSADARRIIAGELWRTVTALTLHADFAHALSNAVAAALFFNAVTSTLGAGLGGASILLAGALGNLANAFLQGSSHVAIGASTAVFGAVGMLGGLEMRRRRRRARNWARAWLPIAAALALLGMLGSGGERVDIWAHLCGLLVGIVLGSLIAPVALRAPKPGVQWACGTAAIAVIVSCWILAFR